MKLLLVEDDQVDAEIVQRSLVAAECDYEVEIATSLSDAVTKLEHLTFDIILADLGLPDGAGLANITTIRNASPETPIVVLTGWDGAVAKKLIAAGAAQFLTKNEISTSELVKKIQLARDGDSSGSDPVISNTASSDNESILEPEIMTELEQLTNQLRLQCSDLLLECNDPVLVSRIREIALLAKLISEKLPK